MTRARLAPGEKPLHWTGSAKADLKKFPEAVQDELGAALEVAQFGGTHFAAKPWRGLGPGVLELIENYRGDTYRAIYTVRFKRAVYALHAFQKKSPTGIKTARTDIELIRRRLRLAAEDYEATYGEESHV